MSPLNCPIGWSSWGQQKDHLPSLFVSPAQRIITFSNSSVPSFLPIYYCRSNWIASCINFLFILVSLQFYFFHRFRRCKLSSSSPSSSSSSSCSVSSKSSKRSLENLHKQSTINHLKNSYSHHQFNPKHQQKFNSTSAAVHVRSISQSNLPVQSEFTLDEIDCSFDNNQKSHLINLWNQMVPKILLDISILVMIFVASLSAIEILQYQWINWHQHLNGRLITILSTFITLLINYFIVLPQFGLFLLKPGYGSSLYRLTFLIILVSYWTVTVINLIYQTGILMTIGLSFGNHVRLQLTLLTLIVSTCILGAKLTAILMTKVSSIHYYYYLVFTCWCVTDYNCN